MSDGKPRFPAASLVCISSVDLASYAFLVGIDAEVPLKCHRVRASSKKEPVAFHLLAEMQRFLGKRAGSRATEVSLLKEEIFLDKYTNISTIVGYNNNPTEYNCFTNIIILVKFLKRLKRNASVVNKNKLQIGNFKHDVNHVPIYDIIEYKIFQKKIICRSYK